MDTPNPKATPDENADHEAVNELISDIAGELHLHLARVQEFMDGTPEYPPVESEAERVRLEALRDALSSAVCGVDGV